MRDDGESIEEDTGRTPGPFDSSTVGVEEDGRAGTSKGPGTGGVRCTIFQEKLRHHSVSLLKLRCLRNHEWRRSVLRTYHSFTGPSDLHRCEPGGFELRYSRHLLRGRSPVDVKEEEPTLGTFFSSSLRKVKLLSRKK